MTNKTVIRSTHLVAGMNLCPQYAQTRTFRTTLSWQTGQVFIAANLCSPSRGVNGKWLTAAQLVSMNSELEMARLVQSFILPRGIPDPLGLEIVARYLPMNSVRGHFYDFLVVDDKHLGILTADVSGRSESSRRCSVAPLAVPVHANSRSAMRC